MIEVVLIPLSEASSLHWSNSKPCNEVQGPSGAEDAQAAAGINRAAAGPEPRAGA
jgi:hypothetical protein